jgi:hypothetical protein
MATDRGADVVRRDGKAFARFQRSPPARSPSARNGKRSAAPDDHCPVWKKIGKDRGAGVTFYMIWLYMALFPRLPRSSAAPEAPARDERDRWQSTKTSP